MRARSTAGLVLRKCQVHVAIEEAGQQRLADAIDPVVTVEPRTDLDDAAVLDHDVGAGGEPDLSKTVPRETPSCPPTHASLARAPTLGPHPTPPEE